MKKMRTYLLYFLAPAFLFMPDANAQMIKEVHHNREDFFLDITAILQYTSNKSYLAEGATLLEAFAPAWESSYFGPHQREKIYSISDAMLHMSMRSYPHFYEFVSCLSLFAQKRHDSRSFNHWLTQADTLARQSSFRQTADFITYSLKLLSSGMLYESRSRAWYFRNGEPAFGIDSLLYVGFDELDLICSTNRDSTEILKTRGKYYPLTEHWYGSGGRITWRRAGYDEEKVYAELGAYDIDMTTLSFDCDSAVLHNKMYFDFPVPGKLSEKVLSSPPGNRASYPRFESAFRDYEILGFFENINFTGGFGMQGRKLLCSGYPENPARFIFKKGEDYFAVIRSQLFEVEHDKITSSPASFSIYFDQDSIYHPGLQMKYDNQTRLLSLVRLNRGIAQSPFFDAYHRVDLYCEAIYWVMNSDEISFETVKGISQESQVTFESEKYYSEYEYYKLQGIDQVNPLVVLRKYHQRYGSKTVKVGALADFIGKPVEQAVSMLLLLEARGFVVYNSDKREAFIKQRLMDYIDAHAGRIDYDVIHFTSKTRGQSNAVVELATFDMLIRGVPEISISDSQMVYIYPADGKIVMKKNRDFSFSGRVRAGLFEFYAQDCLFEYDSFRINMPRIDSMSFFVKVPDMVGKSGQPVYYRVQAMVEDMYGHMLIDRPDNKSGLKNNPEFPVFTSLGNSFVYYDRSNEIAGLYDRSEFFYELDPFVLDSLDNFSTSGLRFNGYLSTGGITPPLRDELVVMPDYSLGTYSLVKSEEGLPLYDGKAVFYDSLMMDNSGLYGAGKMEYLSSVTKASEIRMYPDSVISETNSFTIDKMLGQVEYADVTTGRVKQKWYPDSNLMMLEMIDEPFVLYDSASRFLGSMEITPGGMKGSGDFVFERARIESRNFVFGHHGLQADTSDFRLFTDTSFTELAFLTDDYRTSLDFDRRMGNFISTGGSSLVNIPFNRFICYMDEIEWEMDKQLMRFRNNIVGQIPDIDAMGKEELIGLELEGAEFISTRPEQDSLRFFSARASYDMARNMIYAEDVKIVKVADAAIFPDDGKLTIYPDALIETLSDAVIIADTARRYHQIYDANVNIFSRHSYTAAGMVDYVDIAGDSQQLFMSSVQVDSLGRTFAGGMVSAADQFMLSPWFSFSGDVNLFSQEQFMRFRGGFGIRQECLAPMAAQPLMDTFIDPLNIRIPVPDSLKNTEGEVVAAGLAFSPGRGDFYPAFMGTLRSEEDERVMSATGLLAYEGEGEMFTVSADATKIPAYVGLQADKCVLEAAGPVELSMDLPYVKLDLYGQANHFIIPDSTRFDLVMGFDFFFDQDILRRFSRSLADANLPGTESSGSKFMGFLKERMPEAAATRVITDLNTFGTIRRLPQELNYAILLSHVSCNWVRSEGSLVSYGDIGVFSIGEQVVNRLVPGYVEIEKRAGGYGVVSLYFEIPGGDWYFFSYRNYIMQAISSDEGFNNELLNLKEDKRILSSKDEEAPYEFLISSRRRMIDFVRKMEDINTTIK
jgi:hypothetical protein